MAPPRYGRRRSSRSMTAIILGLCVLVAGAGVAFVLLKDRVSGETGKPDPSLLPSGEPVPHFAFKLDGIRLSPATGEAERRDALAAAKGVRDALSSYFQAAFVDPAAWADGTFADAWTSFAPETTKRARKDRAALTLGDAAAGISRVDPEPGSLYVRVLLDETNRPTFVSAETRFAAVGVTEDGSRQTIERSGQFYLKPVEGRWMIFGYRIEGGESPFVSPNP